jgi:AbrB family looped-hinge helix DNA binding protein
MTLKIDKAGRVVLPKPVLDRLGLRGGSDLELLETAEGVILKSAVRRPSLIRKGRFLVHAGELPDGYDLVKAVGEARDARARRIWGLNSAGEP